MSGIADTSLWDMPWVTVAVLCLALGRRPGINSIGGGGGEEEEEEEEDDDETVGWLHILLSVVKGIYGRTGVQIGSENGLPVPKG